MSDTTMSREEREAFLADMHVGVLSIPREKGAPLTAPIWYDYEPGGSLWVLTGPESRKGRILKEGLAVTLVAQQEALPYRYVSVEGVVTGIEPEADGDIRHMARRYLGEKPGESYADANAGSASIKVVIEPKRWLSVDYGKAGTG